MVDLSTRTNDLRPPTLIGTNHSFTPCPPRSRRYASTERKIRPGKKVSMRRTDRLG